MKYPSKVIKIVLIAVLLLSAAGCGIQSELGITLSKPTYRGDKEEGYPEFSFRWTRYPDAGGYEIAILARGEDPYGRGPFSVRSVKNIYGNKTGGSLVFLKGVHTDTVNYRVKVRPSNAVDSLKDASNDIWSNIWEIDFKDGKYTISETEEDFDDETGSESENSAASDGEAVSSENGQPGQPNVTISRHVFPEMLTQFMAIEQGRDPESLNTVGISRLAVGVNDDKYGEPRRYIVSKNNVDHFRDAVAGIQVLNRADDITDNPVGYFYSALDDKGNELFSFSLKDNLLLGRDGRYELTAIDTLYNVGGFMKPEEWNYYLTDIKAKSDQYEETHSPENASLTDAAGYMFNRMSLQAPGSIRYAQGAIDSKSDFDPVILDQDKQFTALWKALSAVKTGKLLKNPDGESWHLLFRFAGGNKNVEESVRLDFRGDCVKIGSRYYKTTGLDSVYDSVKCEMFTYLKRFGTAKKIEPVY